MKILIEIEETNKFSIYIIVRRYINEEYVFSSNFSINRNGNINDAYSVLNDIYDMLDDMIKDSDDIKIECKTTCILAVKIFDLITKYIKRGKK